MPEATRAIGQEVERGVHEIGDVGRGHRAVAGRGKGDPRLERTEKNSREIEVVPRAEEGARANDERTGMRLEHEALRVSLAPAIHPERRWRIAFVVGASEPAVEDEIGREGEQRRADPGARLRQMRGAFGVHLATAFRIELGVVDAYVPRGIDHRPRLVALERGAYRARIGDVDLGT